MSDQQDLHLHARGQRGLSASCLLFHHDREVGAAVFRTVDVPPHGDVGVLVIRLSAYLECLAVPHLLTGRAFRYAAGIGPGFVVPILRPGRSLTSHSLEGSNLRLRFWRPPCSHYTKAICLPAAPLRGSGVMTRLCACVTCKPVARGLWLSCFCGRTVASVSPASTRLVLDRPSATCHCEQAGRTL